jgi:hypothetical protein
MMRETKTNRVTPAVLLALALASSACWRADRLPPPASPTHDMPTVSTDFAPLPAGRQWVVLDTPGETANVRTSDGLSAHPVERADKTDSGFVYDFPGLCSTPCVADLRSATQTLNLRSATNPTRVGILRLQLGDDPLHDAGRAAAPDDPPVIKLPPGGDPLVVRYVLPEIRRGRGNTAFYAMSGAGAFATLLGAIMAGGSIGDPPVQGAGFGVIGLGVALLAIGIPLTYVTRGTYTPGAVTWWTVPREPATPFSAAQPR